MLKIISSFIMALPEIIKLIKHLEKEHKKQKTKKKIKDDIKKINQAFEKQDAEALNRIFNS